MAKKSTTKKSASPKTTGKRSTKTKTAKKTSKKTVAKKKTVARDNTADESKNDATIEVDRRADGDRRQDSASIAEDRRKVQRRRQIDPTTCERDYSNDEIEFMHAMDEYKRNNGRMFPTCSEILEVVRSIGYHKMPLGPALPSDVEESAPTESFNADDASA